MRQRIAAAWNFATSGWERHYHPAVTKHWTRVRGKVTRDLGVRGGWEVSYPAPDGTLLTLTAVYVQPYPVHLGMVLPVRVDPKDPRRAVLDHHPHVPAVQRLVVVLAAFSTLLMLAAVGAVLLAV